MSDKKEILTGKVMDILAVLSKKDVGNFYDFVRSPYFNKKERLVHFVKFLQKYHPNFEQKSCNTHNAFKCLYKNEAYKKAKLDSCKTELKKLLEDFLRLEALKQNGNVQTDLLLQILTQKQLDESFGKELERSGKELNKNAQKGVDQYKRMFELAIQDYAFEVNRKGRLSDNVKLLNVIQHLDVYYLIEKVRFACTLLNRQQAIVNEDQIEEDLLLKYILTYLEDGEALLQNIPLLQFYYNLYLLLKSEQLDRQEDVQKHYLNLKKALETYGDKIDKGELRQIFTAVVNYYSRMMKKGQGNNYLNEVFEWYLYMLEKEVLLENGLFAPFQHFRNMVVAGLRLGKLDWTEQFILENQVHIPKKKRTFMVNYSLAEVHFYKESFEETLDFLLKLDQVKKDKIQQIEHKILRCKTYFELKQIEALDSLIHATEMYLSRQQGAISPNFYNSSLNLINTLKKIIKKSADPNYTKDKQILLEEIATTQLLSERVWLQEKVKEMK